MKKTVLKFLVIILLAAVAFELSTFKLYAQNKKVIIDNDNRVIGVPQIKINNTVYVSVVPALELIGWSVKENNAKSRLVFTKSDSIIFIDVEASEININDEKVTFEKPVEIIDGEIYVQSKFIAERLGVQIRWNNKDNLVILSGCDEKSVYVEGEGNIIIAGNGIIINVFEAYSKDTAYDFLSYADRLLSKNKLEEAIDKYKDILENISSDDNYELFMHVLINMGNAYYLLSERKDRAINVNYAIEYYEKALEYYTEGGFVDSCISVQNNLGKLYRVWYEITGDRLKLEKSIDILTKVDATNSDLLVEKALLYYNLGLSQKAADIEDLASENLLKAISFYTEVLNLHTIEKDAVNYAFIHYNIGNSFSIIGEIQADYIKLKYAEEAYGEALDIWSIESFPENYARVHKCLAEVYAKKYILDGSSESLESALAEYKESLLIFSRTSFKMDYAIVNTEMGEVYFKLSLLKNCKSYLNSSIVCLNRALLVYSPYNFDRSIATKLNKVYSYFVLQKGI